MINNATQNKAKAAKETISYFLYKGKRYANNDNGYALLANVLVDAQTPGNTFTIVYVGGFRSRRSVVSFFSAGGAK